VAALAALLPALAPFLAASALSLKRATAGASPALPPMRKAWAAFAVTLVLGTFLGGGLAGLWPLALPVELTGLHAAWGLLGWVAILVMGTAYQVVPMLQLTPAYPTRLTRWLTWLALAALVLHVPGTLWPAASWLSLLALPMAAAALIGFALATLDLLRRRRRKLGDATLDFWRLGMVSLLAVAAGMLASPLLPEAWADPVQLSLGLAFLLGFALSVVSGMLYKIVPFLAWFHLQAQTRAKAGTIPNMKEMIPEAAARLQLRWHLAALVLLLPAPFLPPQAAAPGALCLAASAQVLWVNLRRSRRLFLAHGGRLEPR